MSGFPITIETRRLRRFTRARLIDDADQEVGCALCDLRWGPAGLESHPEFTIECTEEPSGDVYLIIEQDPLSDFYLRMDLGRHNVRQGSILTIRPSIG